MLAACGGEAASGVEVVGCGIEKLCGGKIGRALLPPITSMVPSSKVVSCSFGARRGHRRARRNASRLRIINIGGVQRVGAVARTAGDEHAASLKARRLILAR